MRACLQAIRDTFPSWWPSAASTGRWGRQGTRRDFGTGAFRLVAIAQIPPASGTFVDGELFLLELDGIIAPIDGDGDGPEDFLDNCPYDANPLQEVSRRCS